MSLVTFLASIMNAPELDTSGSQKENKENYIPELKKCGLYEKLQNALKNVSWNCKSLLADKDSNRVETFNSV